MTIGNDTYLMVENAGETASTMTADSMSELSNMSQDGSKPDFGGSFGGQSGDASSGETADAQNHGNRGNAPQRTQNAEAATEESGLIPAVKKLYSGVMDWLYADVNEETQVSGSLVKVTTGMQNDDYIEILSGVSEGDVVLYTGSSSSSSSNTMMSMMMMGGGNRNGGGNRGGNMGGGYGGF